MSSYYIMSSEALALEKRNNDADALEEIRAKDFYNINVSLIVLGIYFTL